MSFTSNGDPDLQAISSSHRRGPTRISSVFRSADVILLSEFLCSQEFYDLIHELYSTDGQIAQFYDFWLPDHLIADYQSTTSVLLSMQRIDVYKHRGGSNNIFIDCHAEYIKFGPVIDLQMWNDGLYVH